MIGFCVPLLIRVCRGPIVVFLAALPLLLVQCASDGDEGASGATPEARPAVVPEDADPGGWHVEGEPRVFEGDDLFDYINGGAEIYHEYGFRKVTIQEYMGKADRGITLEIFEMTDERSAFGIYTLKTGADGESVAVGGGGLIESYYMNFWKGSRLVTLTGFDDHPETVEGLKSIAMAVEEVIGGVKNRPPLVEALRIGGMIEQSVKYIFGPLGLFNACPQVSGKIFGFTEAAAADFKAGYKVVLFRYAVQVSSGPVCQPSRVQQVPYRRQVIQRPRPGRPACSRTASRELHPARCRRRDRRGGGSGARRPRAQGGRAGEVRPSDRVLDASSAGWPSW